MCIDGKAKADKWRPRETHELMMRRVTGGLWASFGPVTVDGNPGVQRRVRDIVRAGLALQQAGQRGTEALMESVRQEVEASSTVNWSGHTWPGGGGRCFEEDRDARRACGRRRRRCSMLRRW